MWEAVVEAQAEVPVEAEMYSRQWMMLWHTLEP
jgi:hypothetical protein